MRRLRRHSPIAQAVPCAVLAPDAFAMLHAVMAALELEPNEAAKCAGRELIHVARFPA